MTFGTGTRTNLLACTVSHSLPGRVRLRNGALRYLAPERETIAGRVAETHGVQSVVVTPITGSVLVTFDPTETDAEALRELVEFVIGDYALDALKEERTERFALPVSERRIQSEPIGELVSRVVAAGAALVISAFGRRAAVGAAGAATAGLGRFLRLPFLASVALAWPILQNGTRSLIEDRRPNADTLSATAILASLVTGQGISALTIILLADVAELLTAYSMDRTRRAIREMLQIGQEQVWKRVGEEFVRVPLEEVAPGDVVMAGTGERVSVDGRVITGSAAVDQASITGEFMPATRTVDDPVFAGTVIKSGSLVIEARSVGDQTAAGRIIHLVEEATHRKANIQFFADRFSAQFIPVNFALAALVLLITRNPVRALNMLIIDYSCGVRLSTATALASAISNAARQGVLIKGGNYLELLAEADTLVLDKTGTITTGNPVVTAVHATDGSTRADELLALAAAAEKTVTHPMANAIVSHARRERIKVPRAGTADVQVGRGVVTTVGGKQVVVGSRAFLREQEVSTEAASEYVARCATRGESVVYVAVDGRLRGIIGVQDDLKETMKKAINRLRNSGYDDIILLTGDVEQQAEVVSSRMSLDRFKAEVMPENKAETILRLQSKGTRVVMVGDGINDAPALAYADVGIAMGATRTDIAIEAADIAISRDEPLLIPGIVGLARQTMRIVKQNFAAAIGINSAGLVLSSLGYLPVFWAAVLHNATTVMVVANSTRLLVHDLSKGGKS